MGGHLKPKGRRGSILESGSKSFTVRVGSYYYFGKQRFRRWGRRRLDFACTMWCIFIRHQRLESPRERITGEVALSCHVAASSQLRHEVDE